MPNDLHEQFSKVRARTEALAQPLSEADLTIQAADFASPGKWHLAHTTWFFEEFFLSDSNNQRPQSQIYRYFFNSYYETVGQRQAQGKRGLISRPDLSEIMEYRKKINLAVLEKLALGVDSEMAAVVELGIQHEQQHQELFMTDILYNLSQNPFFPAYDPEMNPYGPMASKSPNEMIGFSGGLEAIGHNGNGFGFDNEFPLHQVFIEPFALSSNVVTNSDWVDFIEDGGYRNPLLWLADGWKTVQTENWQTPLFWSHSDCGYQAITLAGLKPILMNAPVTHISYYEADAYARWAGKRLPSEYEWEHAMTRIQQPKLLLENSEPLTFDKVMSSGQVWEWTSSAYAAYPRFKARSGAIGEYNGKFMSGQYVLRGGAWVTPTGHCRPTYRNFFYPHQRWQFTGLRLADDSE